MTIKKLYDLGLIGAGELINIIDMDKPHPEFSHSVGYLNLSPKYLDREVFMLSAEVSMNTGLPFMLISICERLESK